MGKLFGGLLGGKSGEENGAEAGTPPDRKSGGARKGERKERGRPARGRGSEAKGAGRDARDAREDARARGAALREGGASPAASLAGKDGAPSRGDAGPRRASLGPSRKKPDYAGGPHGGPNGGPHENGSGYFRPQGSLVAEPAPSVDNLPEPEKLWARKRNFGAALLYYAMLGCVFVVCFQAIFLPIRYALSGGATEAASQAAAAASSSEAAEQARSLAVPFAAAYLRVDTQDGPEGFQARVTPFLAEDLPADVIALQSEGVATREVISTDAYRTEKLRDDRWAVYTESVVSTTGPETPDAEEPSLADPQALGSSYTAADGENTTTVRRVGLEVFVGQDAAGRISVVSPPNVIAARGPFTGEPGAIVSEDPQTLSDGPVASLLEGYLAAAYGSAESRASVENFLVPGASAPPPPAPGLEFLGLEDGVVYEVDPPRGSDLSAAYDVEVYVSVRDPLTGTTSTQTHVMRVGETEEGWKIVGGPGSVGS